MKKNTMLSLFSFACLALLPACNSEVKADTSPPRDSLNTSVRVDNLTDNQRITEQVPTLFRIVASTDVASVVVSSNGTVLGKAEVNPEAAGFRFRHAFTRIGEQDLKFEGFAEGATEPLATQTFRIRVVAKGTPAPSRYFNAYILKAVDQLTKNWGLLGYDITKQLTHPIDFNKQGILKPTGGGLTMCVSGVLETIITAFEIYSKETGDKSVYSFLSFDSWNTLRDTNIKAHIWVNPKLNSSGTSDAVAKFGIGETLKFRDLQPGSFININRTTGTGHAVVFLAFIDIKGQDVAEYTDKVVGFRYFGAQGKRIKGQGGFSYRHAIFSKFGCPEMPFQRDCNVIYSDSQKLLTTGMMWDPADWKKKSKGEIEREISLVEPLSKEEEENFHPPTEFDGLTTDD